MVCWNPHLDEEAHPWSCVRSIEYSRREGNWSYTIASGWKVTVIWSKVIGMEKRKLRGHILYKCICNYIWKLLICGYLDNWILRLREKGIHDNPRLLESTVGEGCILFTFDVPSRLTCWVYTLAAGCCVLSFCWLCDCDQTCICVCGVILTRCHGNLPGYSCLMSLVAFMNRRLWNQPPKATRMWLGWCQIVLGTLV